MSERLISENYEGEYIESSGTQCPVCKSESIVGRDQVEVNSGAAWQSVKCMDCGATWQDVYSLVGIDNLQTGDE
jgi:predicted Zn finger-like uncharacterized protein